MDRGQIDGTEGRRSRRRAAARMLRPDKTSVAQFLERWLAHIQTQVAPRTYGGYAEKVRNNLIPALGAIRLFPAPAVFAFNI
jgi:Phage integrase, N-terminal SAM-like domain